MLIAHYAPALLAASDRRAPPLGALFVAASLVDITFYLLSIAGIEHSAIEPLYTAMNAQWLYDTPWSHSLLGTLGLAAGFAVAWRLMGGSKDAAWIGAGVVAAHWFVDLIFHAPDLTLAGGGRLLGLGLWNHPYVAMPLVLLAVALSLTLYANQTRSQGRAGSALLILLAIALFGVQLVDWLGTRVREAADPVPAGVSWHGLAVVTILAVLAWWTGLARTPCPPRRPLARSDASARETRR